MSPPFPSRQTIRQIVSAFVNDEEGFLDTAREAGLQESAADAEPRFLRLAELPEFEDFFSWLSRRDPGLMQPCRWLVFGPKLAPDAQDPPNFGELQRLIQRVRECRPDFSGFLHQMLAASVLATVVVPALPTEVPNKPVRFTGSESSVEVVAS